MCVGLLSDLTQQFSSLLSAVGCQFFFVVVVHVYSSIGFEDERCSNIFLLYLSSL